MTRKEEVVQSRYILDKLWTGHKPSPSQLPSLEKMKEVLEQKDCFGHRRNGTSMVGEYGI
jgi:hypothetical protein